MKCNHYTAAAGSLADPTTSLREACKQLTLLELHLAVPANICPDCILKHLLCAEAFAEEAAQMSPRHQGRGLAAIGVAEAMRWVQAHWRRDPAFAAEQVRLVRKVVQPLCEGGPRG